MATNPVCIGESATVAEINAVLASAKSHNGFPVVGQHGFYRGMVYRMQLKSLVAGARPAQVRQVPPTPRTVKKDDALLGGMTPRTVRRAVNDFREDNSHLQGHGSGLQLHAELVDGVGESSSVDGVVLTLSEVADPVVSVPPNSTVAEAFNLFRKMGLRHLPVCDQCSGAVVGVLTRKDLLSWRCSTASQAEYPFTHLRVTQKEQTSS